MHTKTVIVGSAIGLHARPAAIISEAVVSSGVAVSLSVEGGEPVDAGSRCERPRIRRPLAGPAHHRRFHRSGLSCDHGPGAGYDMT